MTEKNIHDRESQFNAREVERTICSAHFHLVKKYKWYRRPSKIPYRAACQAQRGYNKAKEAGFEGSLYDACLQIFAQWSWKRSPAPILYIESQALWNGLAQTSYVEKEEKESSGDEAYQRALEWLKLEIRRRGKSSESKKQIREFAKATMTLEDLSPSQKERWNEELNEIEF